MAARASGGSAEGLERRLGSDAPDLDSEPEGEEEEEDDEEPEAAALAGR